MNNRDSGKDIASISQKCEDIKTFKVALIGDGGTGKSSFVDRLDSGGFRKEYIATVGIEKHEILVGTSVGNVKVTIHDTAGQEKFGPLRDDYYKGVDAAILFFDVTSRITLKNIPLWHRDITRVCSNIPIALCANKVDGDPGLRKVKTKSVTYHTNHDMSYFEMSVKDQKGMKEPIEYLLQKLFNDFTLKLVGSLGTLLNDSFDHMTL